MRKTIAIDLDGVLAQFGKWEGVDHFGDPIPGSVEFTKKLAEDYDIMIHTCRCSNELHRRLSPHLLENKVRAWLDEHGYAYHAVWIGTGKPMAAAYVDDRAVVCRPEADGRGSGLAYRAAEEAIRALISASGNDAVPHSVAASQQ